MRSILYIVLSFITLSVVGQTRSDRVEIQWGSEFKALKRMTQKGMVANDNSGIYNLAIGGMSAKPFLQKFDNSLNLRQTHELRFESAKGDLDFQFIECLGDQIFAFSDRKELKSDTFRLFSSLINKDTLSKNAEAELLIEMTYEGSEQAFNAGKFQHTVSQDSSKILIYYGQPYPRGGNKKFALEIFDAQLNQLWNRTIEIPYPDQLFAIERVMLDNAGKVYFVGKVFAENRSDFAGGDPNYHFIVLQYDPKTEDADEYIVKVESKNLSEMQVLVSDPNSVICAGFYSEDGSNSIRGTFYFQIDRSSKEVLKESIREFSIEFITFGLKEKKQKKSAKKAIQSENAELYELDLQDFIQRPDGGLYLIGEQFWINMMTTASDAGNGSGSAITTYFYNYLDIIIVSINPEGYIEWYQKIPKKQITTNDGGMYSSYSAVYTKNHLQVILNDHPQNLFYTKGEPATFSGNKRRFLPVLISIDQHGNVEREALLNSSDGAHYLRPKAMYLGRKDEIISYAHGRRNHQLARIRFVR